MDDKYPFEITITTRKMTPGPTTSDDTRYWTVQGVVRPEGETAIETYLADAYGDRAVTCPVPVEMVEVVAGLLHAAGVLLGDLATAKRGRS